MVLHAHGVPTHAGMLVMHVVGHGYAPAKHALSGWHTHAAALDDAGAADDDGAACDDEAAAASEEEAAPDDEGGAYPDADDDAGDAEDGGECVAPVDAWADDAPAADDAGADEDEAGAAEVGAAVEAPPWLVAEAADVTTGAADVPAAAADDAAAPDVALAARPPPPGSVPRARHRPLLTSHSAPGSQSASVEQYWLTGTHPAAPTTRIGISLPSAAARAMGSILSQTRGGICTNDSRYLARSRIRLAPELHHLR
ncbi:MAG: hypothetical protein HY904_21590 [Deltaproteobacteria bacterium]|nr:hypothetical protein [Deltaproteobacteria bacterium]